MPGKREGKIKNDSERFVIILYKEIIFSIVIVVVVIAGNVLTQNYMHNSFRKTTSRLEELKQELLIEQPEEIDWGKAKEDFSVLQKEWRNSFEKLAYYIEHDELEKVDTNLVGLKSYIDTEEEVDAISELEKSVFVLNHIEDKTRMNLKNIF